MEARVKTAPHEIRLARAGDPKMRERDDVKIRPGEMAAIVGPNGSGKTTFVKAISGDLLYTGNISINGGDIAVMKPWQAAAMRSVLPQGTALSFPFTAREVESRVPTWILSISSSS